MFHYEKKVLKNGLRIILAPMENTEAVTLLALNGVGSRHEDNNISGISHFLEHLFFKGTKSRPKAGQMERELDGIGASHNAFTSKEVTGFWVKTCYKDFELGLDIISDILQEPLFKAEEIEKERGVILQEINMIEDEISKKIFFNLENVVFGKQPIGLATIGSKESVVGIKREDILAYKKQNYVSGNMVFVVAGKIDSGEAFKKIEKAFANLTKGKRIGQSKTQISQSAPRVQIQKKDSDQSQLGMALLGCDMFDDRRYALNLLSVILGGNMSSKFFTEIRGKLGLAYSVYAYGNQYSDCGYLGMGAGVAHDKLEKTVKKMVEIIQKVKKTGVSKTDLEHAKGFVFGQTALQLESSDEVAAFLGEQELFYGKVLQPEEILKKTEMVSQKDILSVANEILQPSKISMAVIGKHEDLAQKEEFYKKIFAGI